MITASAGEHFLRSLGSARGCAGHGIGFTNAFQLYLDAFNPVFHRHGNGWRLNRNFTTSLGVFHFLLRPGMFSSYAVGACTDLAA